MPAKKVITKERIISGAMEYIRKYGGSTLNARSLAKELGCSTQPIYLSFSNMEELKNVLIEECIKVYAKYTEETMKQESSVFMGYLYAYIRFAYEKPRLFEYVYLINEYRDTEGDKKYLESVLQAIMAAGHYDRDTAYRFYLQSWIYTHGVAVQLVTGYIRWDLKDARQLLLDEFNALKQYYSGEGDHGSHSNQ